MMSQDVKIRPYVEWTAIVVTALGVVWGVIEWGVPPPREKSFIVFLRDEIGMPRTDLVLVGPDGDKRLPDASGIVPVPGTWDGSIASVRAQDGWAEIQTVTIKRADGGTATITIPR